VRESPRKVLVSLQFEENGNGVQHSRLRECADSKLGGGPVTAENDSNTQQIPQRGQQPVATALHTLILLFILSVWAGWGLVASNRMRASEHPHRVTMYLLTIFMEWGVVVFVYFGVRHRGGSIRNLIGGSWSTPFEFLKDWGISILFWFVALVVLSLTAHALHIPSGGQNLRFMVPRSGAEIVLWIILSLTAGICEEIIFRGYLQRQLLGWLKSAPMAVAISALAFGAGHIYQGVKSATVIGVFGLLFGILAEWRKNLRPGMMAHAWHDAISGVALGFIRK
jgi:membrane protease YdiL (CAAX protease family)